jgi:hypothetical protein
MVYIYTKFHMCRLNVHAPKDIIIIMIIIIISKFSVSLTHNMIVSYPNLTLIP